MLFVIVSVFVVVRCALLAAHCVLLVSCWCSLFDAVVCYLLWCVVVCCVVFAARRCSLLAAVVCRCSLRIVVRRCLSLVVSCLLFFVDVV